MKKFLNKMMLMMAMLALMAMPVVPVSATADKSPTGDDVYIPEEPDPTPEDPADDLPDDEYKAPKTADESLALYTMAMAAIALAGTIVIAKKKEA